MPRLIAEEFGEAEIRRLLSICGQPEFVEQLACTRRDYAGAINNTRLLLADERARQDIAPDGVEWSLRQRPRDKLPSESDVRKTLKRIADCAGKLSSELNQCADIEALILKGKGIQPLMGEKGNCPGLDFELLDRLRPLLSYLEQAAMLAAESDYSRLVFPRDHKSRIVKRAIAEVGNVFERFGIKATSYKSNKDYVDTKAAEGGAFWQAVCVVLDGEPSGRDWLESMKTMT